MKDKVLFLVGPTGSGKSELALALARKLDGEIISCDAMQVYRKMDIGTAKPTSKEQKTIPHHLINLISPKSECSVFKHRELALDVIRKIKSKKRLPIVAGGSGFYIKAILDGISPQPGQESAIRKALEAEAAKRGISYLHARLKKIDPKRASKIHPNDKRRIIRALEIFKLSGKKQSEWHKKKSDSLESQGFKPVIFGIEREREELYSRIEERVERMFRAGWVNEVKRLRRVGFSKTAGAAIGYRQILEHLRGEKTLEEAKAEIKKRTRQYAKRQLTWFRYEPRIRWISVSGSRFVPKAAQSIIREFKKGCHSGESRNPETMDPGLKHSGMTKVG
jgi:tRNA dimethylallyltransferase